MTLPETNVFAPENRPKTNRKGSYSNHPFVGAMLVLGSVGLFSWGKKLPVSFRDCIFTIIYIVTIGPLKTYEK